jgi:glutamate-1-semialdehyde 2,1-aminomutase
VRLARACTGRPLVALCDSDPFISYNDWFIATTPMRAGIPALMRELAVHFRYNDAEGLRRLFRDHPADIACVICELERAEPPQPGFLAELRRLCTAHGTLLVADEMIAGFRWHTGGAQKCHGIVPDLSTFGKAMANGFAVSALAGRADLLERGGIRHAGERVFLLSTTHGAETHALAAACATMQVYRAQDVIGHLDRQGRRLQQGVRAAAAANGLAAHVDAVGRPCNLVHVTRDREGVPSQALRALFLQELIRRGVLAPSFVVSFSHGDKEIDRTIEAVDGALRVYRRALEDGVEHYLCGPPVKPVFRAWC